MEPTSFDAFLLHLSLNLESYTAKLWPILLSVALIGLIFVLVWKAYMLIRGVLGYGGFGADYGEGEWTEDDEREYSKVFTGRR